MAATPIAATSISISSIPSSTAAVRRSRCATGIYPMAGAVNGASACSFTRPPRHMRSRSMVTQLGSGCSGFATTRSSTARAITCYARREDEDLSPTLHAGVVLASGVGYEVSGQTSAVWKRGFAVLSVTSGGLDTTRTVGQLTVVSQDIPRRTLIAPAEGGLET